MSASDLNPEQLAVVEHTNGPALVVAGAGTGKTQVITHRIIHLIEKLHILPQNILALTFTEKSAREMESRVAELLEKYIIDVNITTFNAFGEELLRRFSYEVGLRTDLKLMNETQQLIYLKDNIDKLKLNYYAPISNPDGLLLHLVKYFSALKNELIKPEAYLAYVEKLDQAAQTEAEELEAVKHNELAYAYQKYQMIAAKSGVIDYDDQVYLTVKLLEARPNIRSKLQAEAKYIMVDEFQDTNKAQSRLIDLLVGTGGNIVAVGDDDQSIYRFRGAALSNILEFNQRYPKAKQITLTRNYRSTQAILDSAYQLIQYNNPDRLEARYKLNKRLVGLSKGKPPFFKSFLTSEDEADWLANDIARRLRAGQTPGEVAILIRKNGQAQKLAKYLEKVGIDFIVIGQSLNLYQQLEIKLILNYLRVLIDPFDSVSLYHLLINPPYSIDALGLQPLSAQASRQRIPLETILGSEDLDQKLKTKISPFFNQLNEWRQAMGDLSVGQMCFSFLTDTGYLKALITMAKDDPSQDQKIANLNQFFASLREFEQIAQDNTVIGYIKSLPAILGTGERLVLEDLPDLHGQKVKILTVHKAKGLEFDVVYLFDMTQGNFPARRQSQNLELPPELIPERIAPTADANLQEERRLMYVAMTRAKKDLILTTALDHGGKRAQKPSQFIEEALGQYPLKAGLVKPTKPTAQIELFQPSKVADKYARAKLPPSFWQGQNLILNEHQIEDYLMCPAEFKLRHIICPPQPVSFALEYGTLMHNIIQLYNRRSLDAKPPSLNEMLKFLETMWPKEGFISDGHKQRSLAQANKTLKRFYQREQKVERKPVFIERSFSFNIASAQIIVRGRFDAVYQDDEGIEIRDYKTGAHSVTSQSKADKRASSSLQLAIYTLAWYKSEKIIPTRSTLDFIDAGFIGQSVKSLRQLEAAESKIVHVAEGVRRGDFKPAQSHLFCTHHEYGF